MSLLDFPRVIAAIVFTPGCNFRCGYCHNPEFVLPERIAEIRPSFIKEEVLFNFLEKRKGVLDGVVVTGGEPTLMPDLLPFLAKLKEQGFKVKLDTNGNRASVLHAAMDAGLVDYVAMDVKTSIDEYPNLVGNLASAENLRESMKMLMAGSVPYEFRSTLIKETHTPEVIADMVALMTGAKRVALQTFRPGNTLCAKFGDYHAFSEEEMEAIRQQFLPVATEVIMR